MRATLSPDGSGKGSANTHLKWEKNISLHYAAGRPRDRRGPGSASPPRHGTAHGQGHPHGDNNLSGNNGGTSAMGAAARYPQPPPFLGPISAVQQRDVGDEDTEEMENMKIFPTSVQFGLFNFQSQACSSSAFPCPRRVSSREGNR